MTYRVMRSRNREEWLENRRSVLTGTEIAQLMTGGARTWERVRAAKAGAVQEFDTRYMQWGRLREPEIAQFVKTFVDSRLEANDQFLVSDELGFGCTPDMIGGVHHEGDGLVADIVGEIKTSKYPVPRIATDAKWLKYLVQCQVELMVTGADELVFAWEQHDDQWPTPTPHDISCQSVEWDKPLQKKIVETVERFYEGAPPGDAVTDIVRDLRRVTNQIEALKAQDRVLRDQLKEQLQVGDKLAVDGASVSYYEPAQRSRFDTKAFTKAHPDLAEEYTTITAAKPMLRVTFTEES